MSIDTKQQKTFLRQGVTLIELTVVLGLLGVLFGLSSINYSNLIPKANITTTADVLVAELKQSQQKSMSGETGTASASGQAQPYGVHIDSNQYVLYSGITYSAESSSNSAFPVAETVELSTTFPSGNILFDRGSGEISGYTSSESATITIRDSASVQQKVIHLNRLGVITNVE